MIFEKKITTLDQNWSVPLTKSGLALRITIHASCENER